MSDYKALVESLNQQLGRFRKANPEVMQGFSQLAKASTQDGALSKKYKELIAIALAVAGHCPGCIGFHTKTLVDLGVSEEELMETLSMAVYMGGGPSLMYAAEVLKAYDELS